jgi:hypothetical protein
MPINQDYILYVAEEDAAKQKELLMKPGYRNLILIWLKFRAKACYIL